MSEPRHEDPCFSHPQDLPPNKAASQDHINQSGKEQKAVRLIEKGSLREAEIIFRELIASGAGNHCSYGNLAAICGIQRRTEEAIQLLKEALKIEDKYPIAHNNLGNALKEQGEIDSAIKHYNNAIELDPGYADAHYNLGNTLREKGLQLPAIEHLRKAIESKPDHAQAHNNLGNILKERGDITEAIASYKAAISSHPDFADAQINLGNTLLEQGCTRDAIDYYQKGLEINPRLTTARIDLGVALMSEGKVEEALSSLREAIELNPDNADAHWNYSLALLLKGDYKNGWESYEKRFGTSYENHKPHASPKCNKWNGDLSRKPSKLLLVSEQGLGDTLQFMRYASTLKKEGIDITICAQEKLHSLIRASGIDLNPASPEQANQAKDGEWIPLLSLAKYLGVSPANVVNAQPYLKTPNSLTSKWERILSREQRPIIAINWQGNPAPEQRGLRGRSFKLEKLAALADPSISFLSIQKGYGSDQLEDCTFKDHFVSCQETVNKTWDFLETAAIIANCDLVITSDTYVAHLAGGMGKKTWLLLHQVPDWRWGLKGDKTFWYPSLRIFRQQEAGNWDEVIEHVRRALKAEFPTYSNKTEERADRPFSAKQQHKHHILAPISIGELIDKITILEIKTQHLQDKALENAGEELTALRQTLKSLEVNIAPSLVRRLKEVNQDLWRIEDDIRDKERLKDFDDAFIKLARSVYLKNDHRAKIKKEINLSCNSSITEEKSYRAYE